MTCCVYLDDRCLPPHEALISVFSRAVHYGDGLFETLRICNKKPFRLHDHVSRLCSGLTVLGMNTPTLAKIQGGMQALLEYTGLDEAILKIIVFREGSDHTSHFQNTESRLCMILRQFDTERFQRSSCGITGWVVTPRRNCRSPLPLLKSLNYLENIIGKREAFAQGADEALFLNTDGFLAEGATSNLFIVKNNCIMTPPEHAGILPGVTRTVILEIAASQGIQSSIQNIHFDDLRGADEAFCTNALMGIMPLLAVNGIHLGSGTPGRLTRRLQSALAEIMSTHCS